jgi:hypothetical protein
VKRGVCMYDSALVDQYDWIAAAKPAAVRWFVAIDRQWNSDWKRYRPTFQLLRDNNILLIVQFHWKSTNWCGDDGDWTPFVADAGCNSLKPSRMWGGLYPADMKQWTRLADWIFGLNEQLWDIDRMYAACNEADLMHRFGTNYEAPATPWRWLPYDIRRWMTRGYPIFGWTGGSGELWERLHQTVAMCGYQMTNSGMSKGSWVDLTHKYVADHTGNEPTIDIHHYWGTQTPEQWTETVVRQVAERQQTGTERVVVGEFGPGATQNVPPPAGTELYAETLQDRLADRLLACCYHGVPNGKWWHD